MKYTRYIDELALDAVWGQEWLLLDKSKRWLITQDWKDSKVSTTEYKRRIGEGNLVDYADCLMIPAKYHL